MPKLTDAIDNVFSEARMLLLGGQVLLGFSFRICFEKKFEQIARPAQLAEMVGLGVMTAALGWLIWPAAFHQIKEHGRMTASIHNFATDVLDWPCCHSPWGWRSHFIRLPLRSNCLIRP